MCRRTEHLSRFLSAREAEIIFPVYKYSLTIQIIKTVKKTPENVFGLPLVIEQIYSQLPPNTPQVPSSLLNKKKNERSQLYLMESATERVSLPVRAVSLTGWRSLVCLLWLKSPLRDEQFPFPAVLQLLPGPQPTGAVNQSLCTPERARQPQVWALPGDSTAPRWKTAAAAALDGVCQSAVEEQCFDLICSSFR